MSNVLFRKVEEAISEQAGDGAAISIGVILSIISTLAPIIGKLPCFGGAEQAMAEGGDVAMIAAWRAVVASGYQGDRGKLALALVAKAKAATPEERREAVQTAQMVG